jgi:hypothetical protein
MTKKKKKDQGPIQIELNGTVALTEAADALAAAATIASQTMDVNGLLNAAAGWMELSSKMTDKQSDEPKKTPVGFIHPDEVPANMKGPEEIVESQD